MHDVRKPLKSLTDVLSSHDVPLAFLFGAGTSASIRVQIGGANEALIPAVAPLTEGCRAAAKAHSEKGTAFEEAWVQIERETEDLFGRKDIEAILSRVRQKRDAVMGASLNGLTGPDLEELESVICRHIAKRVAPEESLIPDEVPHDRFASWVKSFTRKRPIEIFTTNYDILIERSLENLRVPLFDGFVGSYRPYFDSSVFDRDNAEIANSWVRLWKIHGSINWRVDSSKGTRSTYRGAVSEEGEMILPSHYKYDESRKMPYRAMQDRLGRVLDGQGTAFVTCGYSFNDEHINETILSHSDRSNAMVFALMYGEPDVDSPVMRLSANRPNFVVIGPEGGRYKGRAARWSPESIVACKGDPLLALLLRSEDKEIDAGNFGALASFLSELGSEGKDDQDEGQ